MACASCFRQLKLIGIKQHLCDLDKAVCQENVGKEANLILSRASTSPHGAADRADEEGEGGRGNEEGVDDEEMGWGLTQNHLR